MNITNIFMKVALLGAEWVMWVLIACSVLSITIMIERVFYFRKIRGDFGDFIQGLTERLNSNDPVEKTAAWCSSQTALEAKVAAVGLERHDQNFRAIEESMNATMIASKTKMDKGVTVLGTLGNNTPFIGLFGTIIGIIQAFNDLATKTNTGPETVMASISEALVATAVGLLVAIPAVIAYNFINRHIKTKMANSDTTARIIMSYFGKTKSET